jgi:hypothetical protein
MKVQIEMIIFWLLLTLFVNWILAYGMHVIGSDLGVLLTMVVNGLILIGFARTAFA